MPSAPLQRHAPKLAHRHKSQCPVEGQGLRRVIGCEQPLPHMGIGAQHGFQQPAAYALALVFRPHQQVLYIQNAHAVAHSPDKPGQ